jgi:(p)ppGpp synthase/HD superfamily hydrolase
LVENLYSILEQAISIAVRAHKGQVDKAGQPYILHPLRVMMRLDFPEERIVAVLHDVIEDGAPEFAEEVRRLLPPRLLEALLAVTKREDEHGPEGYARFVERAGRDPLARRVKIADLKDNLDVKRLSDIEKGDIERLQRYLGALNKLKTLESAK